jgi:hypothetical protein
MLVGLSLIRVELVVAFSVRNTVLFFSANRVAPNLSAMDQNVSVNCISVRSVTLFSVLRVGRTMGACATRISIYLMIRLLGELSANPLAPPHQMSCRHFQCDRTARPVVIAATADTLRHQTPVHYPILARHMIDNDEFLTLGLLSLTHTSRAFLAAKEFGDHPPLVGVGPTIVELPQSLSRKPYSCIPDIFGIPAASSTNKKN